MPDSLTRPAPLPLQIVTGFLGAGKTTLLNRLLKDPALADTVVIVNEFGSVGLDHLLMENSDDGMILMEAGCLCCTIRGELVGTLEDLLRRRDNGRIAPFRRVIIETTGLADPTPVIAVVLQHPYLSQRLVLDGVITLIDAVNGLETLASHEEAVRQAAVADRIVLTKTDLPDARDRLPELREALAAMAPGASVLDAGEAAAAALIGLGLFDLAGKPAEVDAWLAIEALGSGGTGEHRHDPDRHAGGIRAFALTSDAPVRAQTLDLFWSLLTSTHGPKLLRLKGLVNIAEHPEGPLVIHAVQKVMHPPERMAAWPSDDRRSRVVMIVKDLDPAVVASLWSAFLGRQ